MLISPRRIDVIRPYGLILIRVKGNNHVKWGDHAWNSKGQVMVNLTEVETSVRSAFMALDTPWKSWILLATKIPWGIGF